MEFFGNLWKPNLVRKNILLILIALAAALAIAGWLAIQKSQSLLVANMIGSVTQSKSGSAKIMVSAEGVYALTLADLQGAGFPLVELDPAQLSLTFRGDPVPHWLIGSPGQERLLFYASQPRSRYSIQDVYWLTWQPDGENSAVTIVDGQEASPALDALLPEDNVWDMPAQDLPPGAVFASFFLESNEQYNPQYPDGDHWLWFQLPPGKNRTLQAELKQVAPGPGTLRLWTWARSDNPAMSGRHWEIWLNNIRVGDERWAGKGSHLSTLQLPPGVLQDGENQFELRSAKEAGLIADLTYVDRLELVYPRYPVAESDRLSFQVPAAPSGAELSLELKGFSSAPDVIDITVPDEPALVKMDPSAAGLQSGHRYWAAGPGGYLKPERIESPAVQPDLRGAGQGADYLAIGPPELLEPLQPLLDYRQFARPENRCHPPGSGLRPVQCRDARAPGHPVLPALCPPELEPGAALSLAGWRCYK